MYSYGPPHMAVQKQDDQHEHIFSSYVRIRDVVLKTCIGRWTIGRSGETGIEISVLPARHDDDDDDDLFLSIYHCSYLYVYLSVYQSIYLSHSYLSIYLSISFISIYLSISFISIYLSIYLSLYSAKTIEYTDCISAGWDSRSTILLDIKSFDRETSIVEF